MHLLEIWKRSPLLRVALPLMAGVVLSSYDFLIAIVLAKCLLLGCFFFMQNTINKHWSRSRFLFLEGISYTCLCVLTGAMLARSTKLDGDAQRISMQRSSKQLLAVHVLDEPKEVAWGWSVTANVTARGCDSASVPCRGRIALLLQDSLHARSIHADDGLWLYAEISEVPHAKNPFEFDYAVYRARQGVYVQALVEEGHWQCDSLLHAPTWRGCFVRLRERLLDALRAQPIEQREIGVLAALVLGKTTEMDAEVMQAYAAAGAVHVLAVSGLHVALIYMLLKPLFTWLFGKRRARLLRWLIPTALLWFYAALTGFSPSVLRAALMFSCFIVAETFGRNNNIYNTMSASVVVLVVCDPMVIYSMGFVLSYVAVLGIVVLQPRIHAWCYFSHVLLRKAWELTSVSIAAQIATLPVTLYLFHQFPTWFIVTNLLVIPLSTLVLYVALMFFACMWWAAGSAFIGGLLGLLTRIMNEVMEASSHWPMALMEGIHFTSFEFALCSLVVIAASLCLLWQHRRALLVLMGLVSVWIAHAAYEHWKRRDRLEFCFHSVKGHDVLVAHAADTAYTMADSTWFEEHNLQRRHTEPYVIAMLSGSKVEVQMGDSMCTAAILRVGSWTMIENHTVLLVDSTFHRQPVQAYHPILWFTRESNRVYFTQEQLQALQGYTLVLGNTLSKRKRKWLTDALGKSARVVDVKQGAFVLPLR